VAQIMRAILLALILSTGCVTNLVASGRPATTTPRREARAILAGAVVELALGSALVFCAMQPGEPGPSSGDAQGSWGDAGDRADEAGRILVGGTAGLLIAAFGGLDVLAGLAQLVSGRYLETDPKSGL
jgi:hypothetical protein